jgi:hypothetical protein
MVCYWLVLVPAAAMTAPADAVVSVAGPTAVRVLAGNVDLPDGVAHIAETAVLEVNLPALVAVRDEEYAQLPLFDANTAGWAKGAALRGAKTQETTDAGMLEPGSVVVKRAAGDAEAYERGKDYEIDEHWATFGRLPNGRIGEGDKVWVDYRHGVSRLDSIEVGADGEVRYVEGQPHLNMPTPPALEPGWRRLANVWLTGRATSLTPASLYPILEASYPEAPRPQVSAAERMLPKTMEKLRGGGKLTVLAWGDSVTDGGYLPGYPATRWQEQFVERLRGAFPSATIELVSLGWGGRNSQSFLAEPPGSPYNYAEQLLARKPDLIVSEFVNDAGHDPAGVEALYGRLLADFQGIGAEWIILTPHYVRPDWMGLASERDCDDDPRPYVRGVREFGARHDVAVADAARRWGRLWRQGIPYTTLLSNAINHPTPDGMRIFADSLMELFPAPRR